MISEWWTGRGVKRSSLEPICATNHTFQSQSQSYVMIDSQSASLSWCQATIRTRDKFSLDSCGFVILWRPLWREDGSVIYCCCLTSPAQSLSGPSPSGFKTILYCPKFWDSHNLEGQVPVFISPRDRVAQFYPRALGALSAASYHSQGYGGGCLTLLHTG
jgi:hypothetical protein